MLTFGYSRIVNGEPVNNFISNDGWLGNYYFYFKNFMDIEIKLINEIDTKYYYIIDVMSHSDFKSDIFMNTRIPLKVIQDIENKKAKILLLFSLEAFDLYIADYAIKFVNYFSKNNRLPNKSIIIVSGNLEFNRLENNIYADYIPYTIWEDVLYCSNRYTEENINARELVKKSIEEKSIKRKIYLCYNRRPRLHRLKMVFELYKKDLLKFGLVSLNHTDAYGMRAERFPQRFLQMLPLSIDDTNMNENPGCAMVGDDYINTYFSIITETYTEVNFPTEKIFKVMYMLHPFIVVSSVGFLKYLRSIGYKTFSKWIDESYDNEPDEFKRIEMVSDQVKILCAKSKESLADMVFEMLPVLEHNLRNLENRFLENRFQKDLELRLENLE
jgi:hypothetical protein